MMRSIIFACIPTIGPDRFLVGCISDYKEEVF